MWVVDDLIQEKICKVKKYLDGKKLILVSNREPYVHEKIRGKIHVNRSIGGVISALDPMMQACGGTWVAWGSGNADFEVTDENNKIEIKKESGNYILKRVWLSEKEKENFYYGFSNRTLWPVSHHFSGKMNLNTAYWKAYKKVNQKFAKAIIEEFDTKVDDTMVWIHDYHLSLAPRFVRKEIPEARIGFFWHIVWPSLEIFRRIPWRKEILKGLLGNDLIGFHTKTYADNFIRCVEQLTPYKVHWEHNQVVIGDRRVNVGVFPIGVDYQRLKNFGDSEKVIRISKRLKKKLSNSNNCKIIFGIDRLDYTKGVWDRLRAYERFLKKYPKFRKKVIFVQLVTPSRSKVAEYKEMKRTIDQTVGRINAELQRADWTPIHSYYRVFSDELLISYYKIADVALVTPLADGMNLVSKEFIAANKGDGILVLSEFTGAAETLKKSIIVNPYDTENVADAIKYAIEMNPEEKEYRMNVLKEQVKNYDVYWWLNKFFTKWSNLYV